MATAGKASFVVAASVAAVEALKDQAGLCRWNYALRSFLQQRARNAGVSSVSGAKRAAALDKWRRGGKGAAERAKRTDKSLTKVMFLESWGPK